MGALLGHLGRPLGGDLEWKTMMVLNIGALLGHPGVDFWVTFGSPFGSPNGANVQNHHGFALLFTLRWAPKGGTLGTLLDHLGRPPGA